MPRKKVESTKKVKKAPKKVIKEEPKFIYRNGVKLELTPRLKAKAERRAVKYNK